MTSLLEHPALPTREPRTEPNRLPAPVRIRRPILAIASIAVVFASVAVFVSIYSRASHQVAVIAITRSVQPGERITVNDLGSANVVVSGTVAPVPVSQAQDIVGQFAAVALVPGSLLTMADVSNVHPLASGDAVVGIALKDGQLPSAGVEPGDQVMVVQTGTPGTPAPSTSTASGGANSSTGVLVPSARVYGVASPPLNSSGASELVSIEVSSTVAAEVSVAAAADQVSLVLLPPAGPGS